LGVEAKQAIDLTTLKTTSTCCESGMDAEKMAKDRENKKSRAIKLLEKA
jgi:hypothetical protein